MNCTVSELGLHAMLGSVADTDRLGLELAALMEPGVVVGLVGPLGAGKTHLIAAIAEGLGATRYAVSSPTFVLIHEYDAKFPIFHFDVYRLSGAEEFEALGASEYFRSQGVCLVEWADRVADSLPLDTWMVHLEHDQHDPERRIVLIQTHAPILEELKARLAGISARPTE
jgi:tRNA threonylcarbamoyladenosine biosynthesis protein TsaE